MILNIGHTLAAFPPRKAPLVPIGWQTEWAPNVCEEDKNLFPLLGMES
jgi:hypothetical protein